MEKRIPTRRQFLPCVAVTLIAAAWTMSGCDMGDPGTHVPEPVVESWLVSGEPLPQVRLTWSQDVNVPYGSIPVAVDTAQVRISLLNPDGTTSRTYNYVESSEDGVFFYRAGEPNAGLLNRVIPGGTYSLTVDVPGYPEIKATTIVPGSFEVESVNNQRVVYQATEQVEIDVTPSAYPGRDAVYIISIESLEPSIEGLTPFLRDAIYGLAEDDTFDPEDLDPEEIQDAISQSSPPLNEANWEVNPDGTLRLKMPWFFVAFYGENDITVSAIDDNIWNFFKQVNAQEGNGGFSPGEIPNVRAGVEGGQGLFGSLTRAIRTVDILREDS